MTTTLRPLAPTPAAPPTDCECSRGRCAFSAPRVRWYLFVWRQAQLAGEPFPEVLRSESRSSTDLDPWIRGGRVDRDQAVDIGIALTSARDDGGFTLHPYNAELIGQWLCPYSTADRPAAASERSAPMPASSHQ